MQTGNLSRLRKFTPQNLFLTVLQLAAGTNNDGAWHALSRTWENYQLSVNLTPAKSSLSEYRAKVHHSFFSDIWKSDLKQKKDQRMKFKGLFIYGTDGDHLDLPASQDVLSQGYQGFKYSKHSETHYPKMYTVQAMDVLNGLVRAFSHSQYVSEIEQARALIAQLETNSLSIYDRLHAKFPTAQAHVRHGSFFLMRVPSEAPTLSLQIKAFVRSRKTSKWINFLPPAQQKKGEKPIRLRLIRLKNPRTLKRIIFMTNLPEKFTDHEVAQLYQRRWEVEVNFRDLTSTLKMNQWHSQKMNGILQEIYALFWLINQVRFRSARFLTRAKSWLKTKYEKSNIKLCVQIVIDHLDLLLRDPTKLNELLDYWIYRSQEKREHLSRSYPRQVKRLGKKYKNGGSVRRRSAA